MTRGDSWDDRLCTVALTWPGADLATRVAAQFSGAQAFVPRRFGGEFPGAVPFDEPVAALVARLWRQGRGLVLIMAAGIAVRSIAPLLVDKEQDPAVLVMDTEGRFVVPLLSGHLGGANDLAREVGRRVGAIPVITTATDAAGKPAAEVWAQQWGLRWDGREGLVRVNAAWANGAAVGLFVDPELRAEGLHESLTPHLDFFTRDPAAARRFPGVLIAVTHRRALDGFATLLLRPPVLDVGVGCRQGADPAQVESGVRDGIEEAGLSPLSARRLVSVDAKRGEPALQRLAAALNVPFVTYSPEVLAKVSVPSPSARVAAAVDTPSVAEAAAIAAGGGRLVLPKVKGGVWTLAVAVGDLVAGAEPGSRVPAAGGD